MKVLRRLHVPWRAPRLWVRLALGFGALLALMVGVVAVAVLQFRALADHGEQVMRQDVQRMLRVQEIDQHAQGQGNAMARLLTAPRSERELIYPAIDAEYATVGRLLDELSNRMPDSESSRLLAEVAQRRSSYRDIFSEVVESIEVGDAQQAKTMFNDAGQPALKALLDAANALLGHEQATMEARQIETQAQIRRSEWLLAVLALAALALAIVLAWGTTASVARPLARFQIAAHRIAGGDYTTRVKVRGDNELGKVAQALNAMAAAVASRESEIENLAFVDHLTGLPNRTMLRRLAGNMTPGSWSLILMDVARLRTVNEVLGFDTGDSLLVDIAARLRCATTSDARMCADLVLARLAGGVFAVLCVASDRADLEHLRAHIDEFMSTPMVCDGHSVDVHLTYGMADNADEPGLSVDGLVQRAELAIGEAKRTRRGWAWQVAVDDTVRERQLSLLSNLRSAAESGELEMWLQPKQCLRTGRTLGMEGLVRWRHPTRGYVSPAEFVPFAERTGHIGVVTNATIDAALMTLAGWRGEHPQLTIAVNVSALDIQDPSFTGRVEQISQRHRAPLDRLRLEITESSLMEDADRALPILQGLRHLGVQLSIDDFGTGYSSLAYLNRLPVNELKIDRSFVAGADLQKEARALLRTIIDLGHSLNMCVTAEGIERPQELALLRELGCDLAQGYLISRPLDPRAAQRYVSAIPKLTPEPALT